MKHIHLDKIKNTEEMMTDQILIEPSEVKGHKLIIKNTAKKTKPKLRFELIFILSKCMFFIIVYCLK